MSDSDKKCLTEALTSDKKCRTEAFVQSELAIRDSVVALKTHNNNEMLMLYLPKFNFIRELDS